MPHDLHSHSNASNEKPANSPKNSNMRRHSFDQHVKRHQHHTNNNKINNSSPPNSSPKNLSPTNTSNNNHNIMQAIRMVIVNPSHPHHRHTHSMYTQHPIHIIITATILKVIISNEHIRDLEWQKLDRAFGESFAHRKQRIASNSLYSSLEDGI